uniref:Uncharacterized protein n=1 Tax=Daphnia magna TaxID=35525 RepID=A0A0N8EH40_9CRUS
MIYFVFFPYRDFLFGSRSPIVVSILLRYQKGKEKSWFASENHFLFTQLEEK